MATALSQSAIFGFTIVSVKFILFPRRVSLNNEEATISEKVLNIEEKLNGSLGQCNKRDKF